MNTLNKITALTVKLLIFLIGLSIAIVPIIYILGSDPLHTQTWSSDLQLLSSKSHLLSPTHNNTVFNIYLRQDGKLYNLDEIKCMEKIADYLSYELEQKGVFVRRRVLQFKQPNRKGKKGQSAHSQITHSTIQQKPILGWLKDIIEPFIAFEHEGYKQLHWIIQSPAELQTQIAEEIKSLKTKHPQQRFILLSINKLKHKIVQASTAFEVSTDLLKAIQTAQYTENQPTKEPTKQKTKVRQGKDVKEEVKDVRKLKSKGEGNKTIEQL